MHHLKKDRYTFSRTPYPKLSEFRRLPRSRLCACMWWWWWGGAAREVKGVGSNFSIFSQQFFDRKLDGRVANCIVESAAAALTKTILHQNYIILCSDEKFKHPDVCVN